MAQKTSAFYADYPEQPYISPARDLALWEKEPENFPYGSVEKRQMIRLEEGVLPGHIVLLWRVHFGNFTTEIDAPVYFEYRYGIDMADGLNILMAGDYIEKSSASDSLDALNMGQLKKILAANGLGQGGKKDELMARLLTGVPAKTLEGAFALRKYKITPLGQNVLDNHQAIIQMHGPKS